MAQPQRRRERVLRRRDLPREDVPGTWKPSDGGPRQRPFIVLNATDIVEGAQFSFTQNHFERLCSDLDGVHVARGVTASSVAFPPLTLANYPKTACG